MHTPICIAANPPEKVPNLFATVQEKPIDEKNRFANRRVETEIKRLETNRGIGRYPSADPSTPTIRIEIYPFIDTASCISSERVSKYIYFFFLTYMR